MLIQEIENTQPWRSIIEARRIGHYMPDRLFHVKLKRNQTGGAEVAANAQGIPKLYQPHPGCDTAFVNMIQVTACGHRLWFRIAIGYK